MIAQLEADAGVSLLERHPRGSRPTAAGVEFAAHARDLIAAVDRFVEWRDHRVRSEPVVMVVGASMTIAEHLLPAWLAEFGRRRPSVRVDVQVLNSHHVLEEVRDGHLQLGFIETPNVPGWVNTQILQQDELGVIISPRHSWAERSSPIPLDEVIATPLVVREGGSGTREAFEEFVGTRQMAEPAQVPSSNAAVRIAVAAGAAPAVLSTLAVRAQLDTGELMQVPLQGIRLRRPLTAVWMGPRHISGPAADLLTIARGLEDPPAAPAATSTRHH